VAVVAAAAVMRRQAARAADAAPNSPTNDPGHAVRRFDAPPGRSPTLAARAEHRRGHGDALTVLVSVVIPAYNAEPFLADAIDSILTQSYPHLELIVIDDASTDGTWEIARRAAERDTRVRAHRNPRNLGIAGNRNRGVALAAGTYLAWQDADDVSMPTRLERQVQYMEAHPGVAIVGGYIELFRGTRTLGVRRYPEDDASLRRCIFRYSPIAQPVAMLRLDALRTVGEYDLRYPPAEDLDMTFRLGQRYALGNVPEVLLRYRESDASATFTRLRDIEISTVAIRRRYRSAPGFRMTWGDALYNAAHRLSIHLVPAPVKIRLFNLWRNTAGTNAS
jgi:glycosyltransferase involved in cell wall biosynthesis